MIEVSRSAIIAHRGGAKISQVITLKNIYYSEKINAHKEWGWLQFIGCQRKKKKKESDITAIFGHFNLLYLKFGNHK